MTPRERIRQMSEDQLRATLEFYDTDRLRQYYTGVITEAKQELARRSAAERTSP